jgi:hypothetical protein
VCAKAHQQRPSHWYSLGAWLPHFWLSLVNVKKWGTITKIFEKIDNGWLLEALFSYPFYNLTLAS